MVSEWMKLLFVATIGCNEQSKYRILSFHSIQIHIMCKNEDYTNANNRRLEGAFLTKMYFHDVCVSLLLLVLCMICLFLYSLLFFY